MELVIVLGTEICVQRSLTDRRVSIEFRWLGGDDKIDAVGKGISSLRENEWVVLGLLGSGRPGDKEAVGSVHRVKLSRKGGGRERSRDA